MENKHGASDIDGDDGGVGGGNSFPRRMRSSVRHNINKLRDDGCKKKIQLQKLAQNRKH